MTSPSKRIRDLSREVNAKQVRIGYLAEDYDGIQQYIMVQLSQGSSSSAMARISIGGGSYKTQLEAGAKVSLITVRGGLEIISLGG